MNGKSDAPEDFVPAHYLHRAPSGIIGIISVIAALVILGYAVAEVRQAGHNQPALSLVSTTDNTEGISVLRITPKAFYLDNQPVSESDIIFRLSGAAGRSPALLVEYPEDLPIAKLTQALDLVNRAGFAQIGLRPVSQANSTDVPK